MKVNKKMLWAILAIIMATYVAACGDGTDNPNPTNGDDGNVETDGGVTPDSGYDSGTDAGNDGGNDVGDGGDTGTDGGPCATCTDPNEECLEGVCVCKEGFQGPDCTEDICKDMQIDPADWLVTMVCAAGEPSCTMTVALPANDPDSNLNGTYFQTGAPASQTIIYVMGKAKGIGVPANFFAIDLPGVELKALAGQPYKLEDGKCVFNEVPMQGKAKLFLNRFGTIFFYDGANWVPVTFVLVETGIMADLDHLSAYYVMDSAPTLVVTATANTDNTVSLDFTGTKDEGSNASFLFQFSLKEGETEIVMQYAGDTDHPYLWKSVSALAPGTHDLTAIVMGKNFNSTTHPEDKTEKALEVKIETPDPCEGIDCGSHGHCETGACKCDEGYAGDRCQDCANGYHREVQICVINSHCEASSCNGHGNCNDSTGVIQCTCNTGYSGATCNVCDVGYQDKNSDGSCELDCAHAGLNCGHGQCSDLSGTALCVCDTGWALPNCSSCASGYLGTDCHRDWCDLNTCLNGGTCANEACQCPSNYTGATCNQCAAGRNNDYPTCSDNLCEPDPCNGHGNSCEPTTGACTCAHGYTGATCNSCSAGHIGYPTCSDDPCYGVNCNGHGTCSGGTCGCNTGFDPAQNCGACAAGYWDYPVCHVNHAPVVSVSASPNPCGSFDTTIISLTATDSDGDNLPWELTLANPNGGNLSNPSSGTCDTATHCSGTCIGGNCTGINKITVTFNTGDTTNATATVTANDGRGGLTSTPPPAQCPECWIYVQ